MRRPYCLNLDIDKVEKLDLQIIRPCSRSDVINDLIQFALDSGYVISAFIKSRNDDMAIKGLEGNITH